MVQQIIESQYTLWHGIDMFKEEKLTEEERQKRRKEYQAFVRRMRKANKEQKNCAN